MSQDDGNHSLSAGGGSTHCEIWKEGCETKKRTTFRILRNDATENRPVKELTEKDRRLLLEGGLVEPVRFNWVL